MSISDQLAALKKQSADLFAAITRLEITHGTSPKPASDPDIDLEEEEEEETEVISALPKSEDDVADDPPPPAPPLVIEAPAITNNPPSVLTAGKMTVVVEPPSSKSLYAELYMNIGDEVDTTTNQVTNRVGEGSGKRGEGIYSATFTDLPTDGRDLWIEIAAVAQESVEDDDPDYQNIKRVLVPFKAHKAERPQVNRSVSVGKTNNSGVHHGFGRLIKKPPMKVCNPNSRLQFGKGHSGQTVQEMELHMREGATPKRLLDVSGAKDFKIKKLFITMPESAASFSNDEQAICAQFYRTQNLSVENLYVRGGKAGIRASSCQGTRIEQAVSWACARHSIQINKEQPYKGKHGYVKNVLCYAYTLDELKARGLRPVTGSDTLSIHGLKYNQIGGKPDYYTVDGFVVLGSFGKNSTLAIHDGGDFVYGKVLGGGARFMNGALLFPYASMFNDAGGKHCSMENVLAWSRPNNPNGMKTPNTNYNAMTSFDYGRPPISGGTPGNKERDMDRSGGIIKNCRFRYEIRPGDVNGHVIYPAASNSTKPKVSKSGARYWSHPHSDQPKLINSNMADPTLTLAETWAHAQKILANLDVFEDKDKINLTQWSDYVKKAPAGY